MIDPVTLFYRLKPGMEVIEKVRGKYPQGMFILVDICHFTIITRDFGLTFRDVVLEEFSKMFLEVCAEDLSRPPVMIRAGSDELLAWIPKITEESCRQKLEKLKERFSVMIRQQCLKS